MFLKKKNGQLLKLHSEPASPPSLYQKLVSVIYMYVVAQQQPKSDTNKSFKLILLSSSLIDISFYISVQEILLILFILEIVCIMISKILQFFFILNMFCFIICTNSEINDLFVWNKKTCSPNEYFDVNTFSCVLCDPNQFLVPSHNSKFLIPLIVS